MNDEAARSQTGEILDQATQTPTPTTTADSTTTTVDTTKPTDQVTDKPADDTKPAPAAVTGAGAPETYADFKAPEGLTLDPKLIQDALPLFKELNLSQDQAQKLIDQQSKLMAQAAKAPLDAVTTMRNGWKSQVAADADIRAAVSGDKTGLDAVKVDVSRALNALGDAKLASEFKDAMDLTGAGDHPAFIKTFWKLSQFITEGTHVAGKGPSSEGQRDPSKPVKPTPAQALYPRNPTAA